MSLTMHEMGGKRQTWVEWSILQCIKQFNCSPQDSSSTLWKDSQAVLRESGVPLMRLKPSGWKGSDSDVVLAH